MHTDQTGTLLKCGLWFPGLGWGLRFCISYKLLGDAATAGLGILLWAVLSGEPADVHTQLSPWHFPRGVLQASPTKLKVTLWEFFFFQTYFSLHDIILPVAHAKNLEIVFGFSFLSFPIRFISKFYWLSPPIYIPNLSTWLHKDSNSRRFLSSSYMSECVNVCSTLKVYIPPKFVCWNLSPLWWYWELVPSERDRRVPLPLPHVRTQGEDGCLWTGPHQALTLSAPWSWIFNHQNCGK